MPVCCVPVGPFPAVDLQAFQKSRRQTETDAKPSLLTLGWCSRWGGAGSGWEEGWGPGWGQLPGKCQRQHSGPFTHICVLQ